MSPDSIAAIRAVGGPGEYCLNLLSSLLPSDGEQLTFLLGDTRVTFNKEIICSFSPFLSNLLQDMSRAGCCCANGHVFISLPLELSPTSVLSLQTVLQDGVIHHIDGHVMEQLKDAISILGLDIGLVTIQEEVNQLNESIHIKQEDTQISFDLLPNNDDIQEDEDHETSQLDETMELVNNTNSYDEEDYFHVNCEKIEYTEDSTDDLYGNDGNFLQEEQSIASLNHIQQENLVQTGSENAENSQGISAVASDKNNNNNVNNVLLRMTRNCKVQIKRLDKSRMMRGCYVKVKILDNRRMMRKCVVKIKRLDMGSFEGLEDSNARNDLDGSVRSKKISVQMRNTEGDDMYDINDINRKKLVTQMMDNVDDGKVRGPSHFPHIMETVESPLTDSDEFDTFECEVDSDEFDIERLVGLSIDRLINRLDPESVQGGDDLGPSNTNNHDSDIGLEVINEEENGSHNDVVTSDACDEDDVINEEDVALEETGNHNDVITSDAFVSKLNSFCEKNDLENLGIDSAEDDIVNEVEDDIVPNSFSEISDNEKDPIELEPRSIPKLSALNYTDRASQINMEDWLKTSHFNQVPEGLEDDSDGEDIEKQIELVPKINIKRTLGLEAWWVQEQEPHTKGEEKLFRKPYTMEEDESIVRYMKENHLHGRQRGRKNWQKMEEENVCPGRSWQSMKERWIKHIEGTVKHLDISDESNI